MYLWNTLSQKQTASGYAKQVDDRWNRKQRHPVKGSATRLQKSGPSTWVMGRNSLVRRRAEDYPHEHKSARYTWVPSTREKSAEQKASVVVSLTVCGVKWIYVRGNSSRNNRSEFSLPGSAGDIPTIRVKPPTEVKSRWIQGINLQLGSSSYILLVAHPCACLQANG